MAKALFNRSFVTMASEEMTELYKKLMEFVFRNNRVTDVNKLRKEFSMTIYGVYSDNVDSNTQLAVKRVIEAKYVATLEAVVQQIVTDSINRGGNPMQDVKQLLSNDTRIGALANRPADTVAGLSEAFKEIRPLTGGILQEAAKRGDGDGYSHEASIAIADSIGNTASVDAIYNHLNDQKRAGTAFNAVFKCFLKTIPVDSAKLSELLGDTKDRTALFSYLKARAGASSFWKDFVMNLAQIEKSVQRQTSSSPADRILEAMVRSSGYLSPTMFTAPYEIRQFVLVLERSDVDALRTKYNFDLRKAGALRVLFDNYSILSLCVVDSLKKEVYIYDSDEPTDYDVVNYSRYNDDQLSALFANLIRR
jgi:hypothetical protein